MKITSLRGPSGTNHEGMYLIEGVRSPQLAFDALRKAKDQGEPIPGHTGGKEDNPHERYRAGIDSMLADVEGMTGTQVADAIRAWGRKVYGDEEESSEEWESREDQPEGHSGSGSGEFGSEGEDESESLTEGAGAEHLADRFKVGDRRRRGAKDSALAHDWFGDAVARIKNADDLR